MDCTQMSEWLSAYADGELSEKETQEVTVHLSVCPGCRHRLEELRAADRVLARCPGAKASAGFVDRVRAQMAREQTRAKRWRPILRYAAAAVLLLAVGAAVWFAVPKKERPEETIALPNFHLLADPAFLGTEAHGYERLFPGIAAVRVPIFVVAEEEGDPS
jgi:hypothetical protein